MLRMRGCARAAAGQLPLPAPARAHPVWLQCWHPGVVRTQGFGEREEGGRGGGRGAHWGSEERRWRSRGRGVEGRGSSLWLPARPPDRVAGLTAHSHVHRRRAALQRFCTTICPASAALCAGDACGRHRIEQPGRLARWALPSGRLRRESGAALGADEARPRHSSDGQRAVRLLSLSVGPARDPRGPRSRKNRRPHPHPIPGCPCRGGLPSDPVFGPLPGEAPIHLRQRPSRAGHPRAPNARSTGGAEGGGGGSGSGVRGGSPGLSAAVLRVEERRAPAAVHAVDLAQGSAKARTTRSAIQVPLTWCGYALNRLTSARMCLAVDRSEEGQPLTMPQASAEAAPRILGKCAGCHPCIFPFACFFSAIRCVCNETHPCVAQSGLLLLVPPGMFRAL